MFIALSMTVFTDDGRRKPCRHPLVLSEHLDASDVVGRQHRTARQYGGRACLADISPSPITENGVGEGRELLSSADPKVTGLALGLWPLST